MVDEGVEHIVLVIKQPVVHLPGQTGLPADVADGDIVVIMLEGQPQKRLLQYQLIFRALFRDTEFIHNRALPFLKQKTDGLHLNRNHLIPDTGALGRY